MRHSYTEYDEPAPPEGGFQFIGGAIGVVVVIGIIFVVMQTTGWFIFSFKLAKWIVLVAIALVAGVLGTSGRGDGRG